MYQRLPLNAISRLWGKVNNIDLPIWLRAPGYKFYAKVFGANLDEMEDPDLTHYKNLGEFFYRTIRPEVRPIDESATVVSPCDGRVLKFGVVENGEIEQVKGVTYKVDALLGKVNSKKLAAPTYQITFDDESSADVRVNEQQFLKNVETQGHSLVKYEGEGDKSLVHPSLSKVLALKNNLINNDTNTTDERKLFFALLLISKNISLICLS
ncbi:unnamed protein product [Ambrosiozyma monospora]|uniref:Unnamed protein product n=1 Tax=Ambrosiozyma monospora TaxID=43982 RepID=A0ACB5U6Q5_AMBMO|nr:unnamed protein product [Ambrosiozyma monospora]